MTEKFIRRSQALTVAQLLCLSVLLGLALGWWAQRQPGWVSGAAIGLAFLLVAIGALAQIGTLRRFNRNVTARSARWNRRDPLTAVCAGPSVRRPQPRS